MCGHRRVEAARRAGWNEIDALFVAQDEIDNLILCGIENLSGDDMTADDKADWAQWLVDMGFSQHEISWLQWLHEYELKAGLIIAINETHPDLAG